MISNSLFPNKWETFLPIQIGDSSSFKQSSPFRLRALGFILHRVSVLNSKWLGFHFHGLSSQSNPREEIRLRNPNTWKEENKWLVYEIKNHDWKLYQRQKPFEFVFCKTMGMKLKDWKKNDLISIRRMKSWFQNSITYICNLHIASRGLASVNISNLVLANKQKLGICQTDDFQVLAKTSTSRLESQKINEPRLTVIVSLLQCPWNFSASASFRNPQSRIAPPRNYRDEWANFQNGRDLIL